MECFTSTFLSVLSYYKYLARDDFLVEPVVFIELAPPVCFSASIILASGFLSPRVMPDLGESGSQHNRQLGKKFRKSSFFARFRHFEMEIHNNLQKNNTSETKFS